MDAADTQKPETLLAYRKAHGMSLDAFGDKLDPKVNKSTVMRWEKNGVPVDRIDEVVKLTDLTRAQLNPKVYGNA